MKYLFYVIADGSEVHPLSVEITIHTHALHMLENDFLKLKLKIQKVPNTFKIKLLILFRTCLTELMNSGASQWFDIKTALIAKP